MDATAWRVRQKKIATRMAEPKVGARVKETFGRGTWDALGLEWTIAFAATRLAEPLPSFEDDLRDPREIAAPYWNHTALRDLETTGGTVSYQDVMLGLAASRAFVSHEHLVRLDVNDALQCALLATQEPENIYWDDIALPALGFLVSVPATALRETLHAEYPDEQELATGTHVYVCTYHAGTRGLSGEYAALSCVTPLVNFPLMGRGDHKFAHRTAALLRRYVYNLLIYLKAGCASLEPRHAKEIAAIKAIPKKKRRKVQEERLHRFETDTVFNVTTVLPLDPDLKAFVYAGGLGKPHCTLKNRTLVRGHWRNQVCGEGRKERKLIPIAPHFRGPDLGAQIAATAHTYNVK